MSDEQRIAVDIEVPGTPEQVWDAIATGPGITAWFTPAVLEAREGSSIAFDMGPGVESTGVITGFEPPRRFAYEEDWEAAGRLATEWFVEARSGDTCVVRVVSSLFAEGGDWSRELAQMREGWQAYLFNLRLYLTYFAGERCVSIMARGEGHGSLDQAQSALTAALGLPDAGVGDRVAASAPDAPALAGVVERTHRGTYHRELFLRVDEPARGTVYLATYEWQGSVHPFVHAYLYGDGAPAAVEREEPRWRAWMSERFPVAQETRAG